MNYNEFVQQQLNRAFGNDWEYSSDGFDRFEGTN